MFAITPETLRGMRAENHQIVVKGTRISAIIIAAIDCNGVIDVELVTGNVNLDIFLLC